MNFPRHGLIIPICRVVFKWECICFALIFRRYWVMFAYSVPFFAFPVEILRGGDILRRSASLPENNNGSLTKRQILYQTQRFVSLANNIEKISPNSDGLKILFLRICLESLQSLSSCNKNKFTPIFAKCFSDEGKDYILRNFKLS